MIGDTLVASANTICSCTVLTLPQLAASCSVEEEQAPRGAGGELDLGQFTEVAAAVDRQDSVAVSSTQEARLAPALAHDEFGRWRIAWRKLQ
jgi:hypothetical protein